MLPINLHNPAMKLVSISMLEGVSKKLVASKLVSNITKNGALVNKRSYSNNSLVASPGIAFNPPKLFFNNPYDLKSFYPKSSLLRRSLSSTTSVSAGPTINGGNHSILAQKEQQANANLGNPDLQADFYRSLITSNYPDIVISRFESPNIASNNECLQIYAQALEMIGNHAKAAAVRNSGLGNNAANFVNGAPGVGGFGLSMAGTKIQPIHVIVDESFLTIFLKSIRWILPIAVFSFIAYEVYSGLGDAGGIIRSEFEGSKTLEVAKSDVRFSDVKGCDESKAELEEIVEFLKDPSRFTSLGGKMCKGILLTGPPGTGKTLLARAVAGEAGVPFLFVSGSEFDEMYVGVGARRVRDLFTQAKERSPCIIFIDELDAVGSKRHSKDAAHMRQTLNQLLVELDGFQQNSGVIVIGATNFPESLDKALTRPGRFDKLVTVPLPDIRGRTEILKHYVSKIELSPSVDVSLIARGTTGMLGAELSSLVNQAAVHASRQNALCVDLSHLEWAKDKIMMGAERKSMVMTEETRMATAYHEAGHALMAMYTPDAFPLYKATILPRGQALGITFMLPETDQIDSTRKQYLARMDVAMGGKIAEELIFGLDGVTSGCGSDLQNATSVAKNMVMYAGMATKLGPVQLSGDIGSWSQRTREKAEDEIIDLLKQSESRARKVLIEKKIELERLSLALMQYETLNKEEMAKVIKGEVIDKEKVFTDEEFILKLPHKRKKIGEGVVSVGDVAMATSDNKGKPVNIGDKKSEKCDDNNNGNDPDKPEPVRV